MAAGLGRLLRRAGVPVAVDQLARFVRAVDRLGAVSVADWYWAGRVTLVSDADQLDAYDRVFAEVFRGLVDWAEVRGDANAPPPAHERPVRDHARSRASREPGEAAASAPSRTDGEGGGDPAAREIEVARASRAERLATTDFAELTDDELRTLARLMAEVRIAVPRRLARRHRPHPHGDRLDLRATLRKSRRSGGDPIERVTRRAGERPRKLVVLCDISGSMAPYSRACLQLLHAAAGGRHAEVFSFATRLTRLTRALGVADADAALARAGATAPDWGSGTRIGEALKEFIDRHGRAGLARGAVVVIVSDGWDRDPPAVVAAQMARLSRLAHRIVWINPRTAAPGFAPVAGAMAAALPYCDALVAGHSLAALSEAVAALRDP